VNTLAPILNPFSEQLFSRIFVTTPTARALNVTEVMVDTSLVVATILAPTPQPGFVFAVTDEATNAASNNIIVDGNGQLIEGASTFVINEDNESIVFVWDDVASEWRSAVYARQIVEQPIVFADDVAASSSGFEPAQKVFTQDFVFIDPIGGNDTRDALTPATAWKTNAQLQRAVGLWGVVRPASGTLNIFYLSAPPASDPFTLLAERDGTVVVNGGRTVVASGTITAKVDQDNATNTPWSITDAGQPPGFWADKVRRQLFIPPQGPRLNEATASILLDEGASTARTGEWGEDQGIQVPAMGPQVGETYQVVDFLELTQGPIGSSSLFAPLFFKEARIRVSSPDISVGVGQFTASESGFFDGGITYLRCRVDALVNNAAGEATTFQGSTVAAPTNVAGLFIALWGTSIVPDPTNFLGFFPGGLNIEPGAVILIDGLTCQGDPVSGQTADIFVHGSPAGAFGQVGVLDSEHGFLSDFSPSGMVWGFPAQIYGDVTSMPWGGGNALPISLNTGSVIAISGGGPGFALPNVDNLLTPGFPLFFQPAFPTQSSTSQTAVSFDMATATYVPPGGFPATWASLRVAQPAGGLYDVFAGVEFGALNYPVANIVVTYQGGF
jgi:hypothetical protein